MALFGKKKKSKPEEEQAVKPVQEEMPETVSANEAESDASEEAVDNAAPELSTEEQFKKACAGISAALRVMFPQQMLIGFFYAELQSGGYIDDFCCYATDGRLLERQEIPKLCGISLPDMVSREEKLEQAFFNIRKSALAHTGKNINAVGVTMLGNGQVKLDMTEGELTDGEEEKRYNNWRKRVDMANPKYMPPRLSEEKMKDIQEKTAELYKDLGSEFYTFVPGEDFKIAYFYAENGENGVFYFHRYITSDGEIIDGDELFDRFDMNKEEAAQARVTIVKRIMDIRQVFVEVQEKPFSTMTLSVTAKGEFKSELGFGPTDAEGEQDRLEAWKKMHTGSEISAESK